MSARRPRRLSRRRRAALQRADADPAVAAARDALERADRRLIDAVAAAAMAVRAGVEIAAAERDCVIAREDRARAEARLEQARQHAADALERAA